MNKIDIDKYKRDWVTKYITWPDENGYILKFFKNDWIHEPYSFEKQNNIIEKKKKYIWKFIPETELIKKEDGSYYIRQKYIEWRLLKFVDINQLDKKVLYDLLDLLKWYIDFCKNEWIQIDIFGYQEDICHAENTRKKRYLFYTRLLNSFMSSTNIMIWNDGRVYMVDVCDTIPIPIKKDSQKLQKVKQAVRHAIMELWIKKTIFKIQLLINMKREELIDALS